MKKKILLIAEDPKLLQLYQTATTHLLDKDVTALIKNHGKEVIEYFCSIAPDIVMIFDFEPACCHRQKNHGKETYELLKERCKACKCEIVLTSIHKNEEFGEGELPEKTLYLSMPIPMEKWKGEMKKIIID